MKHVVKLLNQQIKASAECKARLLINPKKYKKQIDICTEEIKQYKYALLILSDVVGQSEQLVCDCGKPYDERDLEHGMCHQCWEPTEEAN